MSRIALATLAAFAVLAGPAHAGGWATVELSEPPAGLVAKKPWRVELIVKQHGITLLDGVRPSVRIDNGAGLVRTFYARPTGRPGRYVAEVTFPKAGEWRTRLFDGFTDAFPHRLSPLTVTAPGAPAAAALERRPALPPAVDPPPARGFPWPQAVMFALVVLLFAAGILATFDRPRLHVGTFTLRGRAA